MTHKLKAVRDAKGVLPGLFACDICRIERRDDGWWRLQVPMRDIGNSRYREFRDLALGGVWMEMGSVRTKGAAIAAAERPQSGEYVWRRPARDEIGHLPGCLVPFSDVTAEIARTG